MEALLRRAKKRNIKLNPEKLQFRQREVKFAGHIMSENGHKPNPQKVDAISSMPAPTDVPGVRRFLGMANYLRKYVEGFSDICNPLRQLTKDTAAWYWSFEQEKAFHQVKEALVKAPVLRFFNERKPLTLQCDASQFALGAALLQDGHPVAFASRDLSPAEERYAQIEKEQLVVVYGKEHFDYFTYGRNVLVESDHKPLQAIMKKHLTDEPRRLQRMLLRLQWYTFSLIFKPRSQLWFPFSSTCVTW